MREKILPLDSCIITSAFSSKTPLLMEIEINKLEEILLVCQKPFLLLFLIALPERTWLKQIEHNLTKKRQWELCGVRT